MRGTKRKAIIISVTSINILTIQFYFSISLALTLIVYTTLVTCIIIIFFLKIIHLLFPALRRNYSYNCSRSVISERVINNSQLLLLSFFFSCFWITIKPQNLCFQISIEIWNFHFVNFKTFSWLFYTRMCIRFIYLPFFLYHRIFLEGAMKKNVGHYTILSDKTLCSVPCNIILKLKTTINYWIRKTIFGGAHLL